MTDSARSVPSVTPERVTPERVNPKRSVVWRYGFAPLAVAAALLLRGALEPWLDDRLPFVLLYGAVATAVWFGGPGPGLLAAGLGFAVHAVVFMPGEWVAARWGTQHAVTLASYAFSTGLIIAFGRVLGRSRRDCDAAIAQRVAAEKAADAERRRLEITLGAIGDGVLVCDTDGLVRSINPVAERMTGWNQSEARGRSVTEVFDIVHESTGATVENPALRALQEGAIVELAGHTVLRRRGLAPLAIEDSAAPIIDDEGRSIGAVLVFHDAQVQRSNERRLTQAHDALYVVIQALPLAVVVLDGPERRVRLWNGAAERMFGRDAGDAIGRPLAGVPPELAEAHGRLLRRIEEGGVLQEVQTTLQRNDGRRVEVRMSAAPLLDGEGRVTGSLLLLSDLTERLRIEASLRQSDATLRAFFDNAPAGIGVVEITEDDDILHLQDNPVSCRIFGVAPGGTSMRRASELGVGRGVIDLWLFHYRQSAALGQPISFEYSHPSDGEMLRYRATVCAIDDGSAGAARGGHVAATRFCYMAEDITLRHATASRLLESEAQARLALDIARLGTWSWDVAEDVVHADARTREIIGLPEASRAPTFRLADMVRRIHDGDWARVEASLGAAVRPESDGRYAEEFRFVAAPGEPARWVLAHGQALYDTDEPVRRVGRVLGSLLDITERKRSEEAMAEADRRKDEFIATLAHELRNPLAPLRNGVHLLRMLVGQEGADGAPKLPAAERPLAIMERQIAHMVRLIDDLLDVARVSGGKLELQRHRIDIADAVRDAVETSQPLIEAAGHRLTVVLPTEPIHVDADVTRLCQVIANLLNNAAKYTPEGGQVRLSVQPSGADGVEVCVEDNGRGIAPDMLPEIFQMFAQVDRSLDRSRGGLGIGLAIARRLVQMHGGDLFAASAGLGQGSSFVVRLPRAHVMAGPAATPEPQGTQLLVADAAGHLRASCRVLIADDNVDAADSLNNLVRLMGYATRVARDGHEAFAMAKAEPPDIALLDIGMPGLDGYELARRIRAEPWGRHIRLVAVTGWGQEADRRSSAEAGFDLHWVKPVDPAALDSLVESVAAGRAAGQLGRVDAGAA